MLLHHPLSGTEPDTVEPLLVAEAELPDDGWSPSTRQPYGRETKFVGFPVRKFDYRSTIVAGAKPLDQLNSCSGGMGLFYGRWVLPRLLDMAMRNHLLDPYRRNAIGSARGLVLEIGVGPGVNLPLYGPAVDRVCAIDPSPELLRLARVRATGALIPVSLVLTTAEQLPFANEVFDTIAMTWTLCSIVHPVAALVEMRRVLKPGGQLLFVEHGLSPDLRIARWQRWLTPFWKRIGGGCHLDRKVDELIRAAGFHVSAVKTGYMRGPKPWTFMYEGQARSLPASPRAPLS